MCRLFGFRSVVLSQVHHSLLHADNALLHQSEFHPDGWGVAYYVAGAPHLIKSVSTAVNDSLFKRVSGIVSSETVIAHLRKATHGEFCITNTHPFQFGNWVFAHNGNIKNFPEHREELLQKIAPRLRRFILGNTDSEVAFYLILTHLSRYVELHRPGCGVDELAKAAGEAIQEICEVCGDYSVQDDGPPTDTYLSFVITNGATMLAHNGGKTLYYSTYKNLCAVKDNCANFGTSCENAVGKGGFINHLIFSSEPLQGENVWLKMEPGQLVGVDWRMQLRMFGESAEAPQEIHFGNRERLSKDILKSLTGCDTH